MPTIGLVFPGDGRLASARSGVPNSLAAGLAEAGAVVRHIRAEPEPPFDRAVLHVMTAAQLPRAILLRAPRSCRNLALNAPTAGAVQTVSVRYRLMQAGEFDGVVQVGSSYALPEGERTVTHDDMTVVQAARAGYPNIAALSRRQLKARIERQRRAFANASACCVVTEWAATSLVEDYGIPREKVHVVGGGRNRESRPAVRDWSRPRFLFVGKDFERKNGPAVLRAFRRLRLTVPEAHLDVVGEHPPLREAGITAHGLLRLDKPEERERLDQLFSRATCFVMPSRHEPGGLVFCEAHAAGIPSIGSTAGGSREFIGDAGRVVHPDDEDGLLEAMIALADPATAKQLGALARDRAALFTWGAVARRVLRALDLNL
jgi:glycosyltransferase involved in cell wall biosynthesis